MRTLIDGHLDLAWNALGWNRDITLDLDEMNRQEANLTDHPGRGRATTSLPELRRGGVAICQATLLARAKAVSRWDEFAQGPPRANLDWRTQEGASAAARGQLAYYELLERRDLLRPIRTRAELDDHWARWGADPDSTPIGYILAMEGSDPIVEPDHAQAWWDLGLRSANLAHYGASRYAVGTGEEGPLTPAGLRLLREFERLGMILDVTHLSDEGFFQAIDAFSGPILASHNNCRALVPAQRQFSDEQLKLLIERGGVIGVALDAWMMYPGWVRGETSRDVVALSALVDHIDHICQLVGNTRHVAIGSDLDGGFGTEQTPKGLDRISDLQKLDGDLAARGYPDEAVDAVFHGNWLRFFREHLPA
ncbi:dipeptidase [Planctomyces sp. SH-PL62]|uniref:dipeptidase n=1 Tax=Planctomyces sp. SH-PL62 TaxID=1636152 RepID=UPI00078CC8D5|nr:membrane dipeptidase [Planctomyces sp. SH-PL62]AMV36340.1 Membrane dipeptidase (Peptidase family M19) [Planctomyces sp. SH-PL62]